MPYVRTLKTASGATAVPIVYSSRLGSGDIEHIGSAHDEAELEVLKAAARQRLVAGQGMLDLGSRRVPGVPLPIICSQIGCLLDALSRIGDWTGNEEPASSPPANAVAAATDKEAVTMSSSITGKLVTETFDYDGGRQVTVYVPPVPPEAVVFAGDGQLISQWGGVLRGRRRTADHDCRYPPTGRRDAAAPRVLAGL